MTSIDLDGYFNEEFDAQQGDEEEENNENEDQDQENPTSEPEKTEVDAGIKVKKVKRKLVTLNAERLKGPRGIIAIEDFFQNIKLKGKGYEKEDLNNVMKRLEHWSHRMFPKYHFDDSLAKIERLGRKKEIASYMTRYRLGQISRDDENKVLSDNDDDRMEDSLAHELPVDEFEDMLNQQIAMSTTYNRLNQTASSVGNMNMSSVSTSTQLPKPASQDIFSREVSSGSIDIVQQPKAAAPVLTDEQKARIEENRRRAMEIRAAKLKEMEEKRLKDAEEKRIAEIAALKERTINIEIDDDFI